jgi:acyl carrier protein
MTETEPSAPATREERLRAIRQFVAERLFRKVEEVQPHSRLIGDLGADSLDFVDIQFQIEKRFGFEFSKDDLLDTTQRWAENGFLRKEIVERFGEVIPGLREQPDPERIPIVVLFQLITVETLLRLVEAKLRET